MQSCQRSGSGQTPSSNPANVIVQGLFRSERSSPSLCPARNPSSTAKIISIISLIASLLALVGVVTLCYLYFFGDASLFTSRLLGENRDKLEVCVPCHQIAQELWEEFDVRNDDVDDDTKKNCCASNTPQYAALFKTVLQRQYEVKERGDILRSTASPVGQTNESAVFAHLLFKPPPPGTGITDTTVQWKTPRESYMSDLDGVILHNHKILIQTPGVYTVYCQILFAPIFNKDPKNPPNDRVIGFYVRKVSIRDPDSDHDFLLKASHTRNDVSKDRHTVYSAGAFRLLKGDVVYVQVSLPGLISHDDVPSFFGIFKTG